eukprot:CAMPEP_0182873212 /NCGR_PEP_ID=MMETSP0034_2-20130328/12190_1 /TAXON_ID=156128 /ORGANISM="Nephroselmis pyriformis, Strain CCMP717" /LENGTH=820 /DNA_ID=CAMNT_0025005847 /DNA_START=36 /DNA_END=2498 /DNA_ORIENTATION=-
MGQACCKGGSDASPPDAATSHSGLGGRQAVPRATSDANGRKRVPKPSAALPKVPETSEVALTGPGQGKAGQGDENAQNLSHQHSADNASQMSVQSTVMDDNWITMPSSDRIFTLPGNRPVFKRDIDQDFEIDTNCKLGRGAFGVVVKAREISTGHEYAVKILMKKRMGPDDVEALFREVNISRIMGRSLNAVYLYAAYEDEGYYFLLMELCTGGDLLSRIEEDADDYTEHRVAVVIRSMVQIAAQCHTKHVVYRDIKPQNFLFLSKEPDSPLKATDFGFAIQHIPGNPPLRVRAGTPAYMAPEVLRRNYSKEADMWAVGVTTYQLLSGLMPFGYVSREDRDLPPKQRYKKIFMRIKYDEPDLHSAPWPDISDTAKDFVRKLLTKSPEDRLSAHDALSHPWLSDDGGGPGPLPGEGSGLLGDSIVQRLQLFSSYGHFKQLMLHSIASRLPQQSRDLIVKQQFDQLREVEQIFHEMDEGKDGFLTVGELKRGLERRGFDLSNVEVQQLVNAVDFTRSGNVRFEELEAALLDWRGLKLTVGEDEWNKAAMEEYDELERSTGHITQSIVAARIGKDDSHDDVREAMLVADMRVDGIIAKDEFLHLVNPEGDHANLYAKRLRKGGNKSNRDPGGIMDPGPGSSWDDVPPRGVGVLGVLQQAVGDAELPSDDEDGENRSGVSGASGSNRSTSGDGGRRNTSLDAGSSLRGLQSPGQPPPPSPGASTPVASGARLSGGEESLSAAGIAVSIPPSPGSSQTGVSPSTDLSRLPSLSHLHSMGRTKERKSGDAERYKELENRVREMKRAESIKKLAAEGTSHSSVVGKG